MGNVILDVDVTRTDSSRVFAQGMTWESDAGSVYQYVKASGAKVVGAVYDIDKDGLMGAALTTTTAGSGPLSLGIPQTAIPDTYFGWVLVGPGKGVVSVLANATATDPLYTTATAGSLDDTATTLVNGIRLTTANGGSTANVACILTTRLHTEA